MDTKASCKDRQTVTVAEAAAALGIGKNQAYAAAHRGEIPAIRIGRRLLVPRAALEQMLALGAGGGPATDGGAS